MVGRPFLDPTVAVVWRQAGLLQIGLDAQRSVALTGVSPQLPVLLHRLTGREASRDVAQMAQAMGRADELRAVLALLEAAGLVADGAPEHTRAGAWVEVVGDGPLAEAVAAGLRGAGVGRCTLSPRSSGPGPDVVVVAPSAGRGFAEFEALMSSGTTHVWAHVRDGRAVVGPLVTPGQTACLRCHDLHRTEQDPAWPRLVLAWEQASRPVADLAAVGLAAAATVRQCVLALQGEHPSSVGATLEEQPGGDLERLPWPMHPGCGCGWSVVADAQPTGPDAAGLLP